MRPELSGSEKAVLSAVRKLKRATCAEIKREASVGRNHVYHVVRALELGGHIEAIGMTAAQGSGRRSIIYSEVAS